LDARIVDLFADIAEGWEFLMVLPDGVLAQLRELQRRGKLDKSALIDPWNRYGHLLRRRQGDTGDHGPLGRSIRTERGSRG